MHVRVRARKAERKREKTKRERSKAAARARRGAVTKVAEEKVVEEPRKREIEERAAAGTAVVSRETLPERPVVDSRSSVVLSDVHSLLGREFERASECVYTHACAPRNPVPESAARRSTPARTPHTAGIGHIGGVRENPLSPAAGNGVAGSAGRRIAFESHARVRLSDRLWSVVAFSRFVAYAVRMSFVFLTLTLPFVSHVLSSPSSSSSPSLSSSSSSHSLRRRLISS